MSARFMGVAMEKVELVFQVRSSAYTHSIPSVQHSAVQYLSLPSPQDLLQLQYEGSAVMKMFGKAKINVNLLIFLLNKKFYSR